MKFYWFVGNKFKAVSNKETKLLKLIDFLILMLDLKHDNEINLLFVIQLVRMLFQLKQVFDYENHKLVEVFWMNNQDYQNDSLKLNKKRILIVKSRTFFCNFLYFKDN